MFLIFAATTRKRQSSRYFISIAVRCNRNKARVQRRNCGGNDTAARHDVILALNRSLASKEVESRFVDSWVPTRSPNSFQNTLPLSNLRLKDDDVSMLIPISLTIYTVTRGNGSSGRQILVKGRAATNLA
jgi:hypothetical protein